VKKIITALILVCQRRVWGIAAPNY